MNIAFRVDASFLIGTGHVMRCLTLANALRERGAVCRFICREHPGNLLELIRKQGFEAVALPSRDGLAEHVTVSEEPVVVHANWLGTDWRTDAEQTTAVISDTTIDWLIVDHYAIDSRWESFLRPRCRKIMVIDDLADRAHDCDLLLDQNLVADMTYRYDGKVPTHCGRMLGPEYALLQPQYAELHPRVPPREGPVRRVLIYFGGADADNLTGRAIATFLSLGQGNVALVVVINPNSPHAATIRQLAAGCERITLHEGLPSLAPLMVEADLTIGAAGSTTWERCCLGLPTLVITLAENQRPIAAELDRLGLVRWLGHKDQVDEAQLAVALKIVFDTGLSPEWSTHCQRLVDGLGVERVTSILTLNAQTKLKARLARLDDESLILQWANDPLVRQNSFAPQAIDPGTHRIWFRKRLRDLKHCRLYVVETEAGFPVGQVRFERTGEIWEISYALDARARGRGLAKSLLQSAMQAFRASTNEALLFGRVKEDNVSSRRVFESFGFVSEKRGGGGEIIYRRLL